MNKHNNDKPRYYLMLALFHQGRMASISNPCPILTDTVEEPKHNDNNINRMKKITSPNVNNNNNNNKVYFRQDVHIYT